MFFDRIDELCNKNHIKPSNLLKDLGLSTSMLSRWKTGTIPHGKTLSKIADYFGVTPNYLLGYVGNGLTDEQSELVRISAELTTEEILKVIDYANLLKRGR